MGVTLPNHFVCIIIIANTILIFEVELTLALQSRTPVRYESVSMYK